MADKHLEINFYGGLKGLAVMQFTQDQARRLGLGGYIKRLPTGTLHVEAEGKEIALIDFLEACQKREEWTPKNDFTWSDRLIGYDRFYIRKFG